METERRKSSKPKETEEEYNARMIRQIGFVPTKRIPRVPTAEEQAASEEEDRMDAKRKCIETQLRTCQSSFSKKRKFYTITNVSTAIQDINTTVDGRLLQFQFAEAPVTFVGLVGRSMAASREEPGNTLIREYVDANRRPQIVDVRARVKAEVREVVRDLFDEKPQQAENRLVQFLNETCTGDSHDVKPFIRHLEPFDIKTTSLVCMLDSIYQQGKGQAAQMTELRQQNVELTRQTRQQFKEQEKKLEYQGVQLNDLRADLQAFNEQQMHQINQLLLNVQSLGHTSTPVRSMQSQREQRATQQAAQNEVIKQLFIIGKDNGMGDDDQLTQTEVFNELEAADTRISSHALTKALTGLGASATRQRPKDNVLMTVYKFIKIKSI